MNKTEKERKIYTNMDFYKNQAIIDNIVDSCVALYDLLHLAE